jgi:hypothetical protein
MYKIRIKNTDGSIWHESRAYECFQAAKWLLDTWANCPVMTGNRKVTLESVV